jgi:Protein of unknown function (DUF1593)
MNNFFRSFAYLCLAEFLMSESIVSADEPANSIKSLACHIDTFQAKPRVFVLTDIGNEPDDQMSLTRFLLYSNDFDVEGLVAVTSTWQREKVSPEIIQKVLSNYGKIRSNLLKHADGFPTLEDLSHVVRPGQPAYGMAAVGKDQMSPGAQLLIEAVDRTDPRPLHVTIWGGANTLAEALLQVRDKRSPEEVKAFVSQMRVYSISDQDDAGPWIRGEFPDLFYIVSPSTQDGAQYSSATWTGISGDKYYRNAPGADFTTVSNKWLDEHVRNKGFLGETYPQYLFIMEGDTPTFLGLINNGLASYRNPGWGGWGGRYIVRQPSGEPRPIWTQGGDSYPGSPNSRDTVIGVDGKRYTSDQATIWRWRKAFQHDFSARMDWTLKEFKDANHNPVVVVNGDSSKEPLMINAKIGTPVTLSAAGTSDPDGNKLKYTWWYYEEAASAISKPVKPEDVIGERGEEELSVRPNIKIENSESEEAKVIPQSAGMAHVILTVEDDGEPSLTSYRRVILTIGE